MDELDIYDDLDEFHEQEEKKSKELIALETKYEEAMKTIEAMKMEKKDLRKKIRIMERNLQSLLDTAKAEVKRKDKIIEELRKEKDDLCFRRNQVPQNTNRFTRRTDPRNETDATQTLLYKDCQMKVNRGNPFKNQPLTAMKKELTTDESGFPSEQSGSRKEFANLEKKVLPIHVKGETNKEIDVKNVMSTNKIEEKLTSIPPAMIVQQHTQIESKETYEIKERDRYKRKYDNESEEDKHKAKYRSRDRYNNDASKTFRKAIKDNSCDRSSSSRNEDEEHSNRRKDDKDKSYKHHYDDHRSYRWYQNEHRDRSGSSDRYGKTNRNYDFKNDSKEKFDRSAKEKSPNKTEQHKKGDRHYKSHQRYDDSPRRSRDKLKNRKRRLSSQSDEDRDEKHNHREEKIKKSTDAKGHSVKKDLALEKIEKRNDNCNKGKNSGSISSNDSTFKNIDSKKSGEKYKNVILNEKEVKKGNLVEACSRRNNDQEDKHMKCVMKYENEEKKTKDKLEFQSEVEFTADSLELKQKLDVLHLIEKSSEALLKSIEQKELENQMQSQMNLSTYNIELKPTEKNKLKLPQQSEKNNSSDKVESTSTERNELKILRQNGKNSEALIFESKAKEDEIGLNRSETYEKQKCSYTKQSKNSGEKIDIPHKNNTAACIDFEEKKSSWTYTNRTLQTKLIGEYDAPEEHTNSSYRESKNVVSPSETIDNMHIEVANITENTGETLRHNSIQNSSKITKKTLEKSTEGSFSESSSKTQTKAALFDELFGTTTSSMNGTGELLENFKDLVVISSSSSRTTSPSLYTDVSRTPPKNSTNTSSNKNSEIEKVYTTEISQQFAPENEEVLRSCQFNSKIYTNEINSDEKESNTVEERYTTLKASLKTTCDIYELETSDKTSVNNSEVENEDSDSKLSILSKIMDNKKIFNSIMEKACQEHKDDSDRIVNQSVSVNKRNPNLASKAEIDENKFSEKSPEHDLQSICLVDISDDEINNINEINNISTKVNEDKGLNLRGTIKLENKMKKIYIHTEPESIDHEVIKEINEECTLLKLASTDQSNKIQQPLAHKENTSNVAETEQQQKNELTKASEENVVELNEDTKTISMADLNSNTIKAHTSISNENTSIIIDPDNEDESSFYNLTLSSDEDDETLASLKKKYKLQQKEKIEILENIRLPTLFQPALGITEIITPEARMEIMNVVDRELSNKEANPISSTVEANQLFQEKAVGNNASISIVDITDNNLKNPPKELMELTKVVDLKPKESEINAHHRKDVEISEKAANHVLKISDEKQLCHEKTEPMNSKTIIPLDNESIPIIDITEDNFKKSSEKKDRKGGKMCKSVIDQVLKNSEKDKASQKKTATMKSKKITSLENESIPIIDITEDSFEKSPKKRMEATDAINLKSKVVDIHAKDMEEEEKEKMWEPVDNQVLRFTEENKLSQKETESMESKTKTSIENNSIPIIDISEDCIVGERQRTIIVEEKRPYHQKDVLKETKAPMLETEHNTENIKIKANKVHTIINATNEMATQQMINKGEAIFGISANNETTAKPRNDTILESSPNCTNLLDKKLNHVNPALPKQILSNQKPINFIKLNAEKCKERRSLTEHNGKLLKDDENIKQQESVHGMLSENIQKTTGTPYKRKTANQLTLKSSINETPKSRKYLSKGFRILNKSPIKTKTSKLLVKESPSKSFKTKNSVKIPDKRKRSSSPVSSPNINVSKIEKSQKLISSAEVKAMLIDGKSPKMSNDSIVSSPINIIQDTNLDEIDKNMEAIFQSPAKLTLPSTVPISCGNSTMLNTTIDETVNLELSSSSENPNKTNDSSFESKRLSLGTTQYIYERVSEDVVNLFITRQRNKKRIKLDKDSNEVIKSVE